MRIAVIAHNHFPIKRPFSGGLEAHTRQLVDELTRQGNDVTLFCKFGSKTNAKQKISFFGPYLEKMQVAYDVSYRIIMQRIRHGSYDLIINNSLHYIPLRNHTTKMAPMITIFHTPPIHEMIDEMSSVLMQPNRTYVAVSEFTARQWSQYCPETIKVVSNGIDLSGWTSNHDASPEPSAAWIGRITPEKGTHHAIEACIRLNLPVTVGGSVYDKSYFKSVIKPLIKHPLVTYVGHVDRERINHIYKNATVALVTPLWDEPFGLVAVEALASGTPVAAFARGGLASLISSRVGSLSKDENVESLMKSILSAMKKDRMTCSRYARESFSVERMAREYLSLYPQPGYVKSPTVESPTRAML